MHQSISSVNHSTDDPGVFDQNFCLGQVAGPKDQLIPNANLIQ